MGLRRLVCREEQWAWQNAIRKAFEGINEFPAYPLDKSGRPLSLRQGGETRPYRYHMPQIWGRARAWKRMREGKLRGNEDLPFCAPWWTEYPMTEDGAAGP
eukprot:NODE_3314_length_408_cov_347.272981_g2782_i0.p1 GENE.NODE_3314_length_408_cov_347.272981_g2782_i0~~NODE_3314_length_408_cov_347.272981_g2782_i0.p1  ORF type:complete len:108 (-),score=18.86 NODE_3314_length_408_cov_347.272981_g2782_i0:83-385(-)